MLAHTYNEVRCSVENNLATLVPKSLFEESALHEYVQKDIDVKPNDFITYDVEPSTDWICVYAPFVNVNNMLLDAFGTFSYYHAVSVWLKALSHHSAADGALVWSLYKEQTTYTSHYYEIKNFSFIIALRLQSQKTWFITYCSQQKKKI